MSASSTRRSFLGRTLCAGTAALVVKARHSLGASAAAVGDELAGLSTYQLGPQIWVRWNNRLVTCYRAHRSQKFPYLYPLGGPATGMSLTAETSLPYPHHRSAYFGCDRVNGGNYWQEGYEQGQILSSGPKLGRVEKESVEILDGCEWRKPGGPVAMTDRRRIVVTVAGPTLRFVDWDIEWTAVQDVTVEKTNHSLFSIRGAEDIVPAGGGMLVNAEGISGEKGTFGVASAWCAFVGKRAGSKGEVTEGVALLDHPGNPWSPCPWFTRDYGFLSPTPFYFREAPWTLGAGKSVRLRYRLVLFAGTLADAGMARVYAAWVG